MFSERAGDFFSPESKQWVGPPLKMLQRAAYCDNAPAKKIRAEKSTTANWKRNNAR